MQWKATSYLDVHGEDLEELEQRIAAFHAWHREAALPEYRALAEEAAKRVARGASHADILWGYDSAIAQLRASVRKGAEGIAPLLDRLTPEQIEHLEMRFTEDNRKFADEFLRGTAEERRKRRAKRSVERLEEWVGSLTENQIERVAQYSGRAPLTDEFRYRDRKRLQGELLAMVRAREAGQRLAERAAHWERGRDPAYASASAVQRSEFFSMLLDVDRLLSTEQRARAAERLRRYAEDFRELTAKAGGRSR